MDELELLEYGFVVFLAGQATYDHLVKAKIPYANDLLPKIQCDTHPVIAQRYFSEKSEQVSSPLFRYISPKSGIGSYQSAYYLSDALMRKGILPVYLPRTGQVKDLMPLLSDDQKSDAEVVLKILRARYIKLEHRHPAKAFMIEGGVISGELSTVELSDKDILRIFGRLPVQPKENVVPLTRGPTLKKGPKVLPTTMSLKTAQRVGLS